MHAVKESHNALVINTHPSTVNENRIKKNIDIVLSLNGNEQELINDFVLSSEKQIPHHTKQFTTLI